MQRVVVVLAGVRAAELRIEEVMFAAGDGYFGESAGVPAPCLHRLARHLRRFRQPVSVKLPAGELRSASEDRAHEGSQILPPLWRDDQAMAGSAHGRAVLPHQRRIDRSQCLVHERRQIPLDTSREELAQRVTPFDERRPESGYLRLELAPALLLGERRTGAMPPPHERHRGHRLLELCSMSSIL